MSKIIELNIASLDFFYLSYDEPNAEINWADLKTKVPWAKRVHGVKGFDKAHKECAFQSETEFFVTVDGDNQIKKEFIEQRFTIQEGTVSSWGSLNHINGLIYGNGGLKCWPKEAALNMNTHEASDETIVDFCWDIYYIQHKECFSTTYVNTTPYQAFRAGFREGVKMSLVEGKKIPKETFMDSVLPLNLNRLKIWCSVGADVDNGTWAMYGTRLGCHMLNLTDWDYGLINDYDWFNKFWLSLKDNDESDLEDMNRMYGQILERDLGLETSCLSIQNSKFFKSVYINPVLN